MSKCSKFNKLVLDEVDKVLLDLSINDILKSLAEDGYLEDMEYIINEIKKEKIMKTKVRKPKPKPY
jgi:pentatricopeptide repeat protein